MEKILFICVHNSARSQMAATYLNDFGEGGFEVESAGFEPTVVNPLVVEAMKEEGYDLSGNTTQSAFDLFKEGRIFTHVITVCEEGDNECPVFPGVVHRLHMPFKDPATLEGSHEDQLAQTREIRDAIKHNMKLLAEGIKAGKLDQLDLID